MKIDGIPYRTLWLDDDGNGVRVIDQSRLPHAFATLRLETAAEVADAIRGMKVRGAPLIGAAAAYGLALALRADPSDGALFRAYGLLLSTRPTAVNLRWALDRVRDGVVGAPPAARAALAYREAAAICDDDVATCASIGEHGLALLRGVAARKAGGTVNVLTHCNAGWLATVDGGTALAPVYRAHDAGLPVHVWVDETRPRNQGAALTAWELGAHGVPYTVIADSAGGHLMQHGRVDLCLVGSDRTTARGDVCNKVGTYLKALAAADNGVPFYVALPHSTLDWSIRDGCAEIPIEERDPEEVTRIAGRTARGEVVEVVLTPEGAPAANFAFDVTPARLVTGLVTERGVCAATEEGLLGLYPERLAGAGAAGAGAC
jgi:methylthioribose-1-phosphate isomerase